ncbi:MAG TPA: cysteine synthase family protein [Candidatus Krumholzibacteria bacterium]|nr:cysteine synthase family protein [Candidatus Krumholzibacteria bacterium]
MRSVAPSTPGTDLPARIGNTPLLGLRRLAPGVEGVDLLGKAEWTNPGGSVKDRAALAIVRDAMQSGALAPGGTLLDATSGNTGISYAILGAALGFSVRLVMPANAGPERRRILEVLGAHVVWTDALEGMECAIATARTLAAKHPNECFYADQYGNDANWRAHYDGTGVEILEQTRGRLTHFIAGLGTSGTFVGTVRRLRQAGSRAHCVAVIPDSPFHGLEGLKHIPTADAPAIYDPSLADEVVEVSTEDAYAMVRWLARHEGHLVGPSSGAALVAARRLAQRDGAGTYVVVLPDSALKYLNDRLLADGEAGAA